MLYVESPKLNPVQPKIEAEEVIEDSEPISTAVATHTLEVWELRVIVQHLEHSDWVVRLSAMRNLREVDGIVLAPHVLAIVRRLEDSHEEIHLAAMRILDQLDGAALAQWSHDHLSSIVQRLEHPEDRIRETVTATLGRMESSVLAPHVPAIVQFLGRTSAIRRVRALRQDSDADVCVAALTALGHLDGATIEPHAKAIALCLRDLDADVRFAAMNALGQLDGKTLAPHALAIMGRLKDWEGQVRMAAMSSLGRIIAHPLEKTGRRVLSAAKSALGQIDAPQRRATARLHATSRRRREGQLERRRMRQLVKLNEGHDTLLAKVQMTLSLYTVPGTEAVRVNAARPKLGRSALSTYDLRQVHPL